MTHSGLERTIEIAVAPDAEAVVKSRLSVGIEGPFEIVVDRHLAPTQVLLRLGSDEREIHLEHMLNEISTTITNYFEHKNPEIADG